MSSLSRSLVVGFISLVLALQAVGLLGVAALFTFETVTQPSTNLAGSVFLDVLIWVFALGAGAATRAFWSGKSGSRGAIIVWQMVLVGVAIASAQGDTARWDFALVIGGPAVIVAIFMLFSRGVSRHLGVGA
ncbi:MAG: hypothetical protein F2574_03300 [Actinobacteria bacterium]|uniref:Unannotated protein n=1 Tax=freshwater metagenome TaxID=449393 RepID=A0A6J6G2P8_9ZZZZ|nr:hypothetical protein [Actinomycetota bacterium]